jgi:hypothetical protein
MATFLTRTDNLIRSISARGGTRKVRHRRIYNGSDLLGKFHRTSDDRISIPPDQLQQTDRQVDASQTGKDILGEPDYKRSKV